MTDDHAVPEASQQLLVDARALRGLAHPLRARLLDELTLHGPATATLLGQRLGESSGATSYHLRQLSRYGFIDDEPGREGGRERWWRVRPGGWNMRGQVFLRDPATRQVVRAVLDRHFQQRRERLERWTALVRERPDDPAVRRWENAAADSTGHVRMTPEETAEFTGALHDFLRSWSERFRDRTAESHPGTESVEVHTDVFPVLAEADREDPRDGER
ncbi:MULTISPECIES: helix-turn-helix domain-containing protein [unclassified Nocardiopsis]|uniref:winged helix-turn-helix domain-containing protein n=1 Tax=unclassified Nocardiopsis TaxID=2649073 RepID=UPI001357E5C5|nr:MULTISPECIES: helix-turn-helix domain-containing protein [unclassified Nocardiopsis]